MSNKNYHDDIVEHPSSRMKNKLVMTRSSIMFMLAAGGLVLFAAVHHHSPSSLASGSAYLAHPHFLYTWIFGECETNPWPSEVYSAFGSYLNEYKGDGTLGLGPGPGLPTTGRPTTTKEATENGWAPINKECVPELGYPWGFNGEITDGAPVTLYYSKETKQNGDGVLTGIAVHYFDDSAPENMIGSIFSKGEDYDTIRVAFRDKDTDVCGGGSLPSNEPSIAVLLADGSGRKSIPVTKDAAEASGEWAKGSCLDGMGTHWWHDIETGSDLSYEVKNLFPIAPMYDTKDGSFNAILFTAGKQMQKWDSDCGILKFMETPKTPECASKTNMWDGGTPGLRQEIVPPFFMCSNFCGATCSSLTGAAGDPAMFATMHWYFVKDATTCTTGVGPACTPK